VRSLTQLRQDARTIFDAGLRAVDPAELVKRQLRRPGDMLEVAGRRYDLAKYRRVHIVGAGKASARMANAIEDITGESLRGGIVIVKYGHSVPLNKIKVIEAGHPVPDEAGANATREIIAALSQAKEDDLILCLLSGGGSALLSYPADNLSLEDKQAMTRLLLDCGAKIQEINAIRKHLSRVKGGRLAQLACPATIVSLILSDVVGDHIESIASGPTAPDGTTFSDCWRIIERYGLVGQIPMTVRDFLEGGVQGKLAETPKPGDRIFEKVQNVIVGNNRTALLGAKQQAEALGYNTLILSSFIEGEAREAALFHSAIAKEILSTDNPVSRPACVISGGETTVTIRSEGLGGRNQEFALAAAIEIDGTEGVAILSGGTDGTDGPTDAAGGIVDGTTIQRAKNRGLDANYYLNRNDSYRFLQATDDLLVTGPTFTNVMDLRLLLVT
jgi:glycerate 2-kinase